MGCCPGDVGRQGWVGIIDLVADDQGHSAQELEALAGVSGMRLMRPLSPCTMCQEPGQVGHQRSEKSGAPAHPDSLWDCPMGPPSACPPSLGLAASPGGPSMSQQGRVEQWFGPLQWKLQHCWLEWGGG